MKKSLAAAARGFAVVNAGLAKIEAGPSDPSVSFWIGTHLAPRATMPRRKSGLVLPSRIRVAPISSS
ncbi:MAG: hypothetical protein RR412_14195, partial [Burkholderiaceae bacterium]